MSFGVHDMPLLYQDGRLCARIVVHTRNVLFFRTSLAKELFCTRGGIASSCHYTFFVVFLLLIALFFVSHFHPWSKAHILERKLWAWRLPTLEFSFLVRHCRSPIHVQPWYNDLVILAFCQFFTHLLCLCGEWALSVTSATVMIETKKRWACEHTITNKTRQKDRQGERREGQKKSWAFWSNVWSKEWEEGTL